MNILPAAVDALIAELGKLPSIGRRTAERLAFHLLRAAPQQAEALAAAIRRVKHEIGLCPTCHFLTEDERCAICTDAGRDTAMLCVVEQALDVIAFEKAGGFRGLYHVLGGHLSPLRGITAEDLFIPDLLRRVRDGAFREIVLATNPSVEGDATALFLMQSLRGMQIRFTRLGRGIPMGGALEYADPTTLRAALESRQAME